MFYDKLSFYVHNVAEGYINQSIRQEYLRPHREETFGVLAAGTHPS